jgi:hypothetical protein
VPRILDGSSRRRTRARASTPSRSTRCSPTGDLEAEARWPQFSERGHRETGVGASCPCGSSSTATRWGR